MILLIVTLLSPSPIPLPDLRIIEISLGLGIGTLAALVWNDRSAEPL